MKILVVDDNELNRKILQRQIKSQYKECQVVLACNGIDALQILKNQTFNIIFMDINMPLLNGLETAKIIRENEKLLKIKRTPIIFITGLRKHETTIRKISIADGYIIKPYTKTDICKYVDAVQ